MASQNENNSKCSENVFDCMHNSKDIPDFHLLIYF